MKPPTPACPAAAWAWAVFAASTSLGVWLAGTTAPVHAWLAGQASPVWFWAVSFVHIDGRHLLVNLLGVLLVQVVFARLVSPAAWCFALLVAAPVAHAVLVTAGRYIWVAGLSSALHAVVAWLAVCLMLSRAGDDASVRKRTRRFGLILAVGLTVKVVLDDQMITRWPEVQARTAGSLHAMAALVAALGAAVACIRTARFPAGAGNWSWRRPARR